MVGSGLCQSTKNMSIEIINKGLMDYQECHQEMLELVKSTSRKNQIWHLEHFPVFTIGISEKLIKENKNERIPILKTDRGGKITYHGPGQLVFYFMLDLKIMPFRPTDLTKTILNKTSQVFKSISLDHELNFTDPGIYIEEQKIASIGMRIKNNFSYHGISINYNTDLKAFNSINPCGLNVKACNLLEYININKEDLHKKLIKEYLELDK